MKVGDLVRCNVTRDSNTLGVVVAIEPAEPPSLTDAVNVLTDGEIYRWSLMRLEVVNESR